MPYTYKVLAQSLPSLTTLADLYTVPSLTSAVCSQLVVCNQTANAVSFRASVAIAGATDATSQYLFYDVTVDANDTLFFDLGITLATTDVVRIKTNTASALSFTLFGTQIT
jgi:hypothetical protein